MTKSRRTIVGVVGGSREPEGLSKSIKWKVVLKDAQEIGRLVAQSKNVILTGSAPGESGKKPIDIGKVHKNAMRAAIDAKGRAIGILPKKKGQKCLEIKTRRRLLTVRTMLSGHERNLINGTTPDVLIALPGGAGTVSEVKIALSTKVPVVYLNSRAFLKAQCGKKQFKRKVKAILDEAFKANPMDGTFSVDEELVGDEFGDPSKAVDRALQLATDLGDKTCYRDRLKDAPEKNLFESEFKKLSDSR